MVQKELAGRVGISRHTLNAIENCRHAPTVPVASRIANVFYASVDQLVELDYDGKPTHRKKAAQIALDRSQATTEKSVDIEGRHEP